jgi:uncharacterized protein YodC (DUF2158 family)
MSKSKVETPLAVGDVVTLKSGGPKMTVAAVYPTRTVSIVWANDGGNIAKADIGIELLKRGK